MTGRLGGVLGARLHVLVLKAKLCIGFVTKLNENASFGMTQVKKKVELINKMQSALSSHFC